MLKQFEQLKLKLKENINRSKLDGPVFKTLFSMPKARNKCNKLSMNKKKNSNFIRFKTKQNRQKLELQFSINDIGNERVNKFLFLGVILDEHLFWKSQIQNVARKVSKSVGIIYKSSFYLNKTSLCTI